MFYIILIVFANIIIFSCNLLFHVHFPFWQLLIACIAGTVGVIAWDGFFAFIIRRALPKDLFMPNKKFFSVTKKERDLYRHIKVKKWKDYVPELGMFTSFSKAHLASPRSPEYLLRFIVESNYGIVIHIVNVIDGFMLIPLYPAPLGMTVGLPIAIVNAFCNLLPIFILRSHLPALNKLLEGASKSKAVE